ncbi:phosphatidate cytidylyltransferase [Candidatus Acetothermia bacterium]|jgi:phosphatidate cytidylyltransferase|nr:phosphatidate cytidylyltransferase [Candidatus Acetothermia bacterium]MCI2432670.1 phosphatidate cytidylyltransferase [Candidatus Acetothermia bacterium]MCI2437458.1 phosphatidate cytidylyltransferase [Candidatus Acetothermia bacterium]
MRDLVPRTLTAIVAMVTVIVALYLGRLWESIWPVAALGAVAAGIAAWEYVQLLERNGIVLRRFFFIGSAMAVIFAYGTPAGAFGELVFWLALISPVFVYLFDSDALRKILATMGGIIYIPYLLHFFYPLYRASDGFLYALLALGMVWGYDIGAYLIGSLWGRHKLAPTISPHKSWEGVIGGFTLSALVAAIIPIWGRQEHAWVHILLLALIVSAFTQSGDLLESRVKRFAQVKDTGGLMPGHGGLLDRIDGLLLALPAIYFYFHLVLKWV